VDNDDEDDRGDVEDVEDVEWIGGDEVGGGSGGGEGGLGRQQHFSSDDSIEGEDVGIVMRKSIRSSGTAGFASLGSLSGSHQQQPTVPDSEKAVGEIRDVFERLGIDVDVGDISGEGEEPAGLHMYGGGGRMVDSDEDVERHSSDEDFEEERREGANEVG
jgi:hypothetical protein